MCGCGRVSRRAVLRGGTALGVAVAGSMLPAVSFAAPDGAEQTRTITGHLAPGAPDWVYLPVEVPARVRELEVRYSYDRPPAPPAVPGNVLDIGIFDPSGHDLGNAAGFRGWSGGARDRFVISAAGATPGYLAGPVDPGTWHVVLGPYTVAPQGLNYQVEVTLRPGPTPTATRPHPAPERATGRGRAWYRGDTHLHTVHSDGLRTPEELAAGARAAGLDFIASTEHNTSSASLVWGEHAGPDLLVVDGEEITTRSGHWLALGLPPGKWIDWRYRDEQPDQFCRFVDEVHDLGGIVVAAHPFCPSTGCRWEFGYQLVDGIEVWNGPWTLDDELAVQMWDGMLRSDRFLPALGNSDAHREPQAIGLPQNVVLADDLATPAVLAGLRSGHGYLAESSAVELAVHASAGPRQAGIGERLGAPGAAPVRVQVDVSGAPDATVRLLTPYGLARAMPLGPGGRGRVTFDTRAGATPWVRVELRRPTPTTTTPDTMVALSNPVFLRG